MMKKISIALPTFFPQWLIKIMGMKFVYQIIYLFLSLIIVKNLNVEEFGSYAYLLSFVVYFSSVPLLGLPTYLQRSAAKGYKIDYKYLYSTAFILIGGLILAFLLMPKIGYNQRIEILLIIIANFFNTIMISISDGQAKYTFQYKIFFISSIWIYICIFKSVILKQIITVEIILHYWSINSVIVSFISLGLIIVFMSKNNNPLQKITTYPFIILDLITLYSVGIPDAFAKFIDRYMVNDLFPASFLGQYSFNLLIVSSLSAFFIRPINSVLLTKIIKTSNNNEHFYSYTLKYYLYCLSIFTLVLVIYVNLDQQILWSFGLKKYEHTTNMFIVCMVNAGFYVLATPFTNLIALSHNHIKKALYCIVSMLIFVSPLYILIKNPIPRYFYFGIMLSYFINFLLCICLEKTKFIFCFESFLKDIKKHLKILLITARC